MEGIAIDILGPLPRMQKNKFIQVVNDYFTLDRVTQYQTKKPPLLLRG